MTTRTYAILEVSQATFDEVKNKLNARRAIVGDDRVVLDMNGLALGVKPSEEGKQNG
jgi:hypothetical protein